MNEEEEVRRIDLREYIEALFREKERALDMAAAERDRAAEVLRDEQRRALLVAETEREKAAAALRAGTDRAIADNFSRLSEQLLAMKESSEAAERHRRELEVSAAKAVDAAFAAAEKAVTKAEEAQQRVNIGQNEFRGSLADQAATLMPRKEVEALFAAATRERQALVAENARALSDIRDSVATLRTAIAVGPSGLEALESRAARDDGRRQGSHSVTAALYSIIALAIGVGGFLLALMTRR